MSKKIFEDEIIFNMQGELHKQASLEKQPKLIRAAECLHAALEILEQQGLHNRANEILNLLEKLAQESPTIKTAKIHSIQQLMEAGVSQRDLREFARGNPIAIAKLNLTLRRLGLADHEISRFLGPNHVMSEQEALKVLNPNESGSILEFQSLAPGSAPSKEKDETLEFHSLAAPRGSRKILDPATKGLTSKKEIQNMLHHGHPLNVTMADDVLNVPSPIKKDNLKSDDMEPGFEDLLNAATFDINSSDDELMGIEIKEDTLEVFEKENSMHDFEDERD